MSKLQIHLNFQLLTRKIAFLQILITKEIIPLVTKFLAERGLELSPEKSKITHINDGFNFLSQNVRKYKGKLLIHPSKEAVESFKNKIKKLFKENRGIPAHALIRIVNPVIRGWSNYHKGVCSERTFARLGTFIYWQLKRWAKHQHGNKNRWCLPAGKGRDITPLFSRQPFYQLENYA